MAVYEKPLASTTYPTVAILSHRSFWLRWHIFSCSSVFSTSPKNCQMLLKLSFLSSNRRCWRWVPTFLRGRRLIGWPPGSSPPAALSTTTTSRRSPKLSRSQEKSSNRWTTKVVNTKSKLLLWSGKLSLENNGLETCSREKDVAPC